jgi:5-deoxy-D-glucuronate isomerase
VHDRIAETIVVDESKKATRLLKVEVEEPEAATDSHPVRAVLDGRV